MSLKLITGLLLMLTTSLLLAQTIEDRAAEPISLGERITISSKILEEERPIFIFNPKVDDGGAGLQVLYLLDAERNFSFAAGMIDFMVDRAICPPILLVGIPNFENRREVDLNPTSGAASFLTFLSRELVPYIDSAYNTVPYRIISGHSSGGIFSTFALLKEPDVFQAAIASSPVFVKQEMNLYDTFMEQFAKMKEWNHFYFHSVGALETPTFFVQQNDSLSLLLKEKAPLGFDWHYEQIEDGDHNFVALPGLQKGLLSLYNDWRVRLSYQVPFDIEKLRRWPEKMRNKFGYRMRIPFTIFIQRAMMLYFDQRMEEALPYFQLAVEQHPDNPDGYLWLARNYESLGKRQEATVYATKALELAKETERSLKSYQTFLEKLKSND